MNRLYHETDGQDVVEYGMLMGAIVLVVLLGVNSFGQAVFAWFLPLAGHITTTGT